MPLNILFVVKKISFVDYLLIVSVNNQTFEIKPSYNMNFMREFRT